jgi:glycerophosphoryl diester phosphodiesterase
MTVLRPDWLTARPIAHRGLHDHSKGIVENSASAARAAMAQNFAIECDVQISRDGEAMVFHDDKLDRLTAACGRVDARSAAHLTGIALRGGSDGISTLPDFLDLVNDSVPLIIEIKSNFTGSMDASLRLAERTAQLAAAYDGPLAMKSFDPRVMAHLRLHRESLGIAHVPLGMVAEAHYDDWGDLPAQFKTTLEQFLHWDETQPDFLSWSVRDLPHAVPHLLRSALGLPVMTWTVRTPEQREIATLWADQVVFEGWLPE